MTSTDPKSGGVRCYYDLLEVERQATDDELKKAYRRLALRWHPDKNPDRVEEATAHFRLVQKAYETLSDPQERAWYDKHRERILKGGLGRGEAYQEERLDVFQYFTSACYDDYDDGEEGYFTVYAKVFNDLAEEERRACDGDEPPPDFPEFGRSDSPYDNVVGPFYSHWETFFTRKSYVWVEKYDTREAPNKYARKAMEKENRAARDAARRERNEEVRTLVAFVKKRDRRVVAERRRLEARAREVEAKAKAMASAARRAHLETASRYQAPAWARTDELEAELAKIEAEHGAGASDFDDSDDDQVADQGGEGIVEDGEAVDNRAAEAEAESDNELMCLVCEKMFRTPGAKQSHDRSKRHRERLELLRAEMARHDRVELLTSSEQQAEQGGRVPDEQGDEEEDESTEASKKSKSGKKNNKKNKKRQQLQLNDSDKEDQKEQNEEADAVNAKEVAVESAGSNDDEDDASKQASSSKKPRRRKDRQRQKQQELLEQRRQEVAEAAADGADGVATSVTQVCKSCRQWFESKNALFKHLKESGHAAVKPGAAVAAAAAAASSARTDSKKSNSKRK